MPETRAGNNERLAQVVDAHKGIIYKVSGMYCRDEEDRKDLVQEIIIQVWKSLHRYDDRFKMSTWIYRISLNVAISFYRKHKTRRDKTQPLAREILQVSESDDHEIDALNLKLLNRFIHELKELDRALMLLYLDGKLHREMADILGITETNVATKIGRIKSLLKEKFSQHQNAEEHEDGSY